MTTVINKSIALLLVGTLLLGGSFASPLLAFADEAATSTEGAPGTDGSGGTSPATIETGDASSDLDSANQVNTNTTDVEPALTPETEGDGTVTADTTVSNTNDAEVGNTGTAEAGTGTNLAEGGSGGASVATGDALASANVINVVNTNIINSAGLLYFLNVLFGVEIDLRMLDLSYFLGSQQGGDGCSFAGCGGALNVINDNTATLTNDVIVRAVTGFNGATATGTGDALIGTGNAYASANVVNAVNTNIINSNYLLLSVNNFGDLMGDIVLPGADFFQELLSRNNALPASTTIETNNTANLGNNASSTADTGGNSAQTSGEGSGIVTTGNGYAGATTYNQVNSNQIGGSSIFFLFRVYGSWTGGIQGLPSGVSWAETPFGVQLMADEEGGSGSGTESPWSSLLASTTNVADITNNVGVYALTGDNKAETVDGTAGIGTGDAYASANVVNLVNTNIIGRNWIFAIFNIFGDWGGNLAFGRPDLWIGAAVEAQGKVVPGTALTYKFTVANMGDADATEVVLMTEHDTGLVKLAEGEELASPRGNRFALGTIRKGETKEFEFHATAASEVPYGSTLVPMALEVTSKESDNNPADNVEELTVVIERAVPSSYTGGGAAAGPFTPDPVLTVQKTAEADGPITPGTTVDYEIVIKNSGGPAYGAVLSDTLLSPTGEEINTQSWDLGTILAGEEITVTYTLNFGSAMAEGHYVNTATLTSRGRNAVPQHAVDMKPVSDTAAVALDAPEPEPQVLGAASCEPLLTTYMRYGAANDEGEVKALQQFLSTEGRILGLAVTGIFDAQTLAAVKEFQQQYRGRILLPWGYDEPTGYVFYTTQKTINDMHCASLGQVFDYSQEQLTEMDSFRTRMEALRQRGQTLPKSPDIGKTKTPVAPATSPVTTEPVEQPTAAEPVSAKPVPSIWSKLQDFFSRGLPVVEAAE